MNQIEKAAVREANARATRIRLGMVTYLHTLADIRTAWESRDWLTLGYKNWDDYLANEFGADRLRVPMEHRDKAIAELRMAGMSQRAISSSLEVPQSTVGDVARRLTGSGQLDQPDRVTSRDGSDRSAVATDHPAASQGEAYAGLAGAPGVAHTLPAEAFDAATSDAGDGEESPGSSPQTDAEGVTQATSADGSVMTSTRGPVEPAPDPAERSTAGSGVTPDQEFMSRFIATLAKSGGWMQFDADRVAELASESTWDAIEAHASTVAHTYERMRKARYGLRVIKGGVA